MKASADYSDSDLPVLADTRDEAERRAQAQLVYHANLLAHLDDAVIATDLEQRVTAWNPAAERLFGWTAAEVVGRLIPEFLPTEFVHAERADVYRRMAEQGQWRGEMIVTARDGRRVPIETTGVLIRDADGQPTGRVGVSRDISPRQAVEAQNATLLEELTVSREQLRALSQRLVATQEAERSYVADQLYNQAGQVLTAAQIQLARLGRGDAGAQLPLISATLNEAIRELHALASRLRPYALDRATLASALRSYLAEFGRQHGLAVAFDAGNAESARPSADVATSLFRSLQEGLTNVARHAFATEIAVAARVEGGELFLTLTDDGVGFDPQAAGLAGGLGLASIRERLKAVGGQLAVESGPSGSTLMFSAPMGDEESPR